MAHFGEINLGVLKTDIVVKMMKRQNFLTIKLKLNLNKCDRYLYKVDTSYYFWLTLLYCEYIIFDVPYLHGKMHRFSK